MTHTNLKSLIFTILTFSSTVTLMSQDTTPLATQWLLDAVGTSGKSAVNAVYMIYSPKMKSKGTGFLLESGIIITNEHVVRGSAASELVGISSNASQIKFTRMVVDADKDLAALIPATQMSGGLTLGDDSGIQVGQLVCTWGYPLGYNGPAPLLSVGYLSGFLARKPNPASSNTVKHLVVNGAFNSGNSGGPLFQNNSADVVGVVVNKALPLFTPFVQSAISAFANNASGVVYNGTDDSGKPISMVESQVVAEVIKSLRDMSQVMIGEAVSVSELKDFLKSNGL